MAVNHSPFSFSAKISFFKSLPAADLTQGSPPSDLCRSSPLGPWISLPAIFLALPSWKTPSSPEPNWPRRKGQQKTLLFHNKFIALPDKPLGMNFSSEHLREPSIPNLFNAGHNLLLVAASASDTIWQHRVMQQHERLGLKAYRKVQFTSHLTH